MQVRPRRVLYGPERALRPFAIEDARAAALLRVSLAGLSYSEPPVICPSCSSISMMRFAAVVRG